MGSCKITFFCISFFWNFSSAASPYAVTHIFQWRIHTLIHRTASTYFNCTTIFSTQTLMCVKLKEIMFNNGTCSLNTLHGERMGVAVAIHSISYAIEDEEVTKMPWWELGNMKTHTRYFIMYKQRNCWCTQWRKSVFAEKNIWMAYKFTMRALSALIANNGKCKGVSTRMHTHTTRAIWHGEAVGNFCY